MRSDDGWSDVTMRNVSSRGMLLFASKAPDKGRYIEIRKGDHAMVCRVMWTEGAEFGVLSQDRLDVEAIVDAVCRPATDRVREGLLVERRGRGRPVDTVSIARRAERNRFIGAAMQFGMIAAGGLAAAVFVTAAAKETLAKPLALISRHL